MHPRLRRHAWILSLSALLLATPMITWRLSAAEAGAQHEERDLASQQAARQVRQPLNNAPVWREVRSGVPAVTAVRGRETNVLIQPTMKLPFERAASAGEAWRLARPPLSTIGGTLIAFTLLALFGFYRWRGSIGVHDFTGPIFAVSPPVLIAIFIRDNLPKIGPSRRLPRRRRNNVRR